MHGTLDTFSVVEVLQMLGRVRRSGTLHIECADRLIDVHFVQGRIAETRDSTRVYADTVLGSLLMKRNLVTDDQLNEALAEQEGNPKPIGTILVDKGFVGEVELRDVLSRQVANTFLAVKTTAVNGTFMFVIDDVSRPVDYITIDTQSVLIEVSSVGGDYVAAFEILGAANTVLVRNRDYESLPRHSIPMGRDEFHVLTLIDDERTLSDIAKASHLEEVTVVSILGKFCQAGVLLAKTEQPLTPVADAELRAHRDSVWAEVSRILKDGSEEAATGEPVAASSDATLDDLFRQGAEPEPEPPADEFGREPYVAPMQAPPVVPFAVDDAGLAPPDALAPEPQSTPSEPAEPVLGAPDTPAPESTRSEPAEPELVAPATPAPESTPSEPAEPELAAPATPAPEPEPVEPVPEALVPQPTPEESGAAVPAPELGVDGSGIDWAFEEQGEGGEVSPPGSTGGEPAEAADDEGTTAEDRPPETSSQPWSW